MLNNSRVIILAAGRAKSPKESNRLTAMIDGVAIVRQAVSAWIDVVETIDVLIPTAEDEVAQQLEGLDINIHRLEFTMERSDLILQQFINETDTEDLTGVFISLGGLYRLNQRELRYLLESYSWRPGSMGIVPKFKGERGHPIWLPKNIVEQLKSSGLTLNQWTEAYPLHMSWLPVDNEAIISDIDTINDLEFVQSYQAPKLDEEQ